MRDEFRTPKVGVIVMGLPFCIKMVVSSSSWGYPKLAGWFRRENPIYKWMITRGTPHFRKFPES